MNTQKLTKRQKKSLAFRKRETSKRQQNDKKHRNELTGMDDDAYLALERQGIFGLDDGEDEMEGGAHEEDGTPVDYKEGGPVQRKKGKGSRQGKSEAEKEDVPVSMAVLKKRKREGDGDGERRGKDEEDIGRVKRAKRTSPERDGSENIKDKTKQKFILFVGNLKYTTTKETIARHFALCDPPPEIRLLTPKVNPGKTKQKLKSKGCAFLEFTHRNALQQALKLHQSNLEGRLINVELTAGGGGKGESRLTKVRERNKALHGQRETRANKEGESEEPLSKPQRFSSTSGSVQKPVANKTWTVENTDDGQTHRGGEKHRKSSKSRQKFLGTGVNAIPVG